MEIKQSTLIFKIVFLLLIIDNIIQIFELISAVNTALTFAFVIKFFFKISIIIALSFLLLKDINKNKLK